MHFGVICLAGLDVCLLPHSFVELLWVVLSVACPYWKQLPWMSVGRIEGTGDTKEGNRK